MNYIILDMEWDSAYHPASKQFINQILQIGAVKLDEQFNIIDVFDVIIRSSFSKRVSKRFAELTGITKEMMLGGVPLQNAVIKYNEWIGDDTVTMTWSNSDLYTILSNEKLLLKGVKFKLQKYLDLQKYIQGEMRILGHECNSQISLGNAAEILGVTTEGYELHNAKDDSLVCATLLKRFYNAERFLGYVRDTTNPEFYRRLCFKPYYITNLNDSAVDKKQLKMNCPICNCELQRNSKWRYHNRNFTANFICNNCNKKLVGRISFRKTYDDVIVKKYVREPKPKTCEEQTNEMQPLPEKV
ncbi:MAG: 3'-5' exonuclease [Acutalibacteraceae bacterium]|nr:3'-5' exonuclease [Acutalibacteraceae bacterium]